MEWIDLNKKKPPAYEDVLVTDKVRCWVAQTFDNLDVFLASHPDYHRMPHNEYGTSYITNARPTHWMPIPPLPPKTEEE